MLLIQIELIQLDMLLLQQPRISFTNNLSDSCLLVTELVHFGCQGDTIYTGNQKEDFRNSMTDNSTNEKRRKDLKLNYSANEAENAGSNFVKFKMKN